MRQFLARVVTTVPSEAAALLLRDRAGRGSCSGVAHLQSGVIDGLRLPIDGGIAGWVARHRQAVRLDDVTGDPRHYAAVEAQTGLAPRTMMCVPLVSKDALRGVIQVMNRVDGSTFSGGQLAPRADPRRPRRDRDRERVALPPGVPRLDHRRPHRPGEHAPLQ